MKKEKLENVSQVSSAPLANGDVLVTALCDDGSIWAKRVYSLGELDRKGNKWECINPAN